MKIYLCKQSDAPMFGDDITVIGAFLHKEHAERYCEVQEAMEDQPNCYSFYVDEIEVQETYNMDIVVRDYFCFVCDTEDDTIEEIEDHWCNFPDEIYKKVGDDTFIDVQDWEDGTYHIQSYSVNSFEEARNLAIQKWSELKNENNKN
ncbi:MAG: hypothetical protein IJ272_10785 [Clostridia bacterium]|nr:hypothetical protein [Clostridia bacterium]